MWSTHLFTNVDSRLEDSSFEIYGPFKVTKQAAVTICVVGCVAAFEVEAGRSHERDA